MANGLGMPGGVSHNPYQLGGGLPQGYGVGGGAPGNIPQLGPLAPFAAPMIQNLFSSAGLIPGQFAGTQNLYDQQRQALLLQQQQAFIQQGSAQDMPTYRNMLRNMGMTNDANINMAAQGISRTMPILGQMFPQQVDALHGGMGSATVMASEMFRGARFGMDPLGHGLGGMASGGRPGQPSALSQYQSGLAASFFQPGGQQAMHGFGMGATGQMFGEMQRRGYMPQQGFGQGNMQSNTQGVVRNVQEMSGVIRAMQDIFGSQGKTGTITELFQALEEMTQGAAGQMTKPQMESLVRRFHATATTTQVGIDAIMATSAAAAQAGDPLGVRRDISASAGQLGTVHGAAIRTGGWQGVRGASDEATIRVVRARVAARGAGSQIANSQAAILRAVEDNPNLDPNSKLARVATAIKAGQSTVDGQPIANFLTPGGLSSMLQSEVSGGNLSQDAANMVRENTRDVSTNQAYIAEHGLMENTARMQGQVDVRRRIFDPAAGRAVVRTLAGAGVGDRSSRKRIAAQLRPIISQALLDAGPEDIRNAQSFQAYITKKIRGPLARLGISGSKADEVARNIANRTWADADKRAKRAGYGGATQMIQLFGTEAGGNAAAITAQRNQTQRNQEALSGATPSGGVIRRLMTAIADPDIGGKDLGEVIGGILGGVDPEAVNAVIGEEKDELDQLNQDLANPEIRGEQRKEMMKRRDVVMKTIRASIMKIRRDQGDKAAFTYHANEALAGKGTSGALGEKVLEYAAEMSADTDFAGTLKESGKSVMGSLTKKQQQLREMARGFEGGMSGLLNDKGEKGKAARKLMSGITNDMQALNKGGDSLERRAAALEKAEGPSGRGDTTSSTARPDTEATAEAKDGKRDELKYEIAKLYVETDGSGLLSLTSSTRTS